MFIIQTICALLDIFVAIFTFGKVNVGLTKKFTSFIERNRK